jgi:cellulose synthase operon protein C
MLDCCGDEARILVVSRMAFLDNVKARSGVSLTCGVAAGDEPLEVETARGRFDGGLSRQAFDFTQSLGSLQTWPGTRGRILASRIAADLGARRLAHALQVRAYRADVNNLEARAFFLASTLERRGPFAAWQLLRQFGEPSIDSGPNKEGIEYLLSLRAHVVAIWRDFENASRFLQNAEQIFPDSPWLAVERSFLLEQQDRYEESLAAAQRSLQLRSWYRPGVIATAHALQLLDRDEEAMELLWESTQHIESGTVLIQLATLQCGLDRHSEADQTLDALTRLSPILESDALDWLAAQRTVTAYRLGDFPRAAQQARQISEPAFKEFAERLSVLNPNPRRVHLPLAFVRQHRVTCSPATLAALAKFWNKPVEHLAIAEEICYDGTPAHSERHWAEQNGFATREFTVTWNSAVALLGRGVPFALHTVEIVGGHAQAVIGFDDLRQTLLIRDPFDYNTAEANAQLLLQRYRASGPRGMAMVPREQADLLDGLELPDTVLYDQLHAVHRCLAIHQRDSACETIGQLQTDAPGHRLTLTAQRALAAYDANTPALLEAIDALLEQFPEDGALCFAKIRCLVELGRRADRLVLLEAICRGSGCDAIFWQHYAAELAADARSQEEAQRWLRRSMCQRPGDAANLSLLADQWWNAQRFDEALELYRFSACLAELQEAPALTYFSAARWLQRTDDALQFLRQRVRRWGAKSFLPTTSLFRAYTQIDEMPQAFAMLEAELQRRPNDADLLLFAAEVHIRFGKLDEVEAFLQAAAGSAQRAQLLRAKAQLSELRSEPAKAMESWKEILALEPLALDAHQSLARLLAQTGSRADTLDYLESVSIRFPHHFGLHQLWVAWMYDEGACATERVIRRLVDSHPESGWARRELAMALGAQGRVPEALVESRRALQIEPRHPQSHCTRGFLLVQRGDDAGARESFREALSLDVDVSQAIQGLLETCHTARERADILDVVAQELRRQPTFGNSLLVFRELARLDWPVEPLLDFLREMLRERPMIWQTRIALIHQLVEIGALEDALKIAQETTARFPLIPEPWQALAFVHRVRCDSKGELAAVMQLVGTQPDNSAAAGQLAEFHMRNGDVTDARAMSERACRRHPLDSRHHSLLASLLWHGGEKDAAIEKIQHSVRLNSEDEWAWGALCAWSAEAGRPQLASRQARELVARRKGESRQWLRLAFALANENQPVEALKVIDQALVLNPRSIEAHDAKAGLLCQLNRHDDALDVCQAKVWDVRVPFELRLRAAWAFAHRGSLPRAITELRQLLELRPGSYTGWRDMADWSWRRGDESGALAAVSQMLRLAPLDPQPYCFRAEIKHKRRDRDGAKQDFQRAFQLDPGCAHAGSGLFDMQVADHECSAAEATLKVLQRQVGGKLVTDCAARLEALRAKQDRDNWTIEHLRRTSRGGEDFEQAVRRLRELCFSVDADPATLDVVFWKLENTGNHQECKRIVNEALESPQANPEIGALWVRAKISKGQWGLSTRLDELMKSNVAAGQRAVMAYARALGANNRGKGLRLLLKDHGHWLKKDARGWASIGIALSEAGEIRRSLQWMSDWRDHSDVGQDVFAALVAALRAKGRDREADEAATVGLAQARQSDEAFYELTLWRAAADALLGKTRDAREALRDVVSEAMRTPFRRIYRLVRGLVEVQCAPCGELAQARKSALRRIRHAFADVRLFRAGRSTRRIFRRVLRRMAIDSRSPRPILWAFWRLYGTSALAGLSVLAMPLILLGAMSAPLLFLPIFAGAYVEWKRRRERLTDE